MVNIKCFQKTIKNVLMSMLMVSILTSIDLVDARFFTVTTAADAGPGSFRQALLDVNQSPEQNIIEFAIPFPEEDEAAVIALITPLPVIEQQVCINGFSQPGSRFATKDKAAVLRVIVDGTKIFQAATAEDVAQDEPLGAVAGLFFASGSDGSVLTGVSMVGFSDPGTAPGTADQDQDAPRATPVALATALILASDNNQVWGNWIGVQPGDFLAKPNDTGIVIAGSNNEIGGEAPAASVLVSNNARWGIEVRALTPEELPDGATYTSQHPCVANVLIGSYIGTDPTGLFAWPNGNGVNIEGKENIVAAGTLISGNHDLGVRLFGDNNLLLSSKVGPNVDGTDIVFNANQQRGVSIYGANNLVCSCHVADNREGGIFLEESSRNALLAGNFIGMSGAGTNNLGFQRIGIILDGADHLIGGDRPDAANLISGHIEDGVLLVGGTHEVRNNRIGTDITGCVALPNGTNGINILGVFPVATQRVRRQLPAAITIRDNLIAGNGITGLRIARGMAFVNNNIIGLNAAETAPLPNKEKGVSILGNTAAFINENNVGFNGDLELPLDAHTGIGVTLPATAAILSTPSFANIAKGIGYFTFDGAQVAPVNGPAAPELTSALSFGSFISVKGRLTDAVPQATYCIEFFSNEIDRIEATEGTEVVGMLETLETDEFGNAEFAIAIRLQRGVIVPFVSATATLLLQDESGEFLPLSTSEFSKNIAVG